MQWYDNTLFHYYWQISVLIFNVLLWLEIFFFLLGEEYPYNCCGEPAIVSTGNHCHTSWH